MPTNPVIDRFIEALRRLEHEGDPDPIVALFADDCTVSNVLAPDEDRGHDGARAFWTRYRRSFDEVESSFRNVIIAGGHAALEWRTRATSPIGAPITYDGVSVLEFDGERIRRFRAFFDPQALHVQVPATAAGT